MTVSTTAAAPEDTIETVIDDITETLVELTTLGPHPIFDRLIASEPETSWVREVFGLGHRDDWFLSRDPVLEAPRPPAHPLRTMSAADSTVLAGLISRTPTGSINLRLRAALQ